MVLARRVPVLRQGRSGEIVDVLIDLQMAAEKGGWIRSAREFVAKTDQFTEALGLLRFLRIDTLERRSIPQIALVRVPGTRHRFVKLRAAEMVTS
jgi:hypothetical protein